MIDKDISKRLLGDGFSSFLYGAGVNVILVEAINLKINFFFLIVATLFIFSDWASRVTVLWRGDREDYTPHLTKNMIDSCCVVTLIIFCVLKMRVMVGKGTPEQRDILFFGFFLIVSYIWNLYVVHIYRFATFKDIASIAVNGIEKDNKIVSVYMAKINKSINSISKEIDGCSRSNWGQILGKFYIANIKRYSMQFVIQFISTHITISNLLVGTLIIVSHYINFHIQTMTIVTLYILIAIVSLILVAALFGCFIDHNKDKYVHRIFFILLIPIYMLLPTDILIILMAFQQVFVTVFMQKNFNMNGQSE